MFWAVKCQNNSERCPMQFPWPNAHIFDETRPFLSLSSCTTIPSHNVNLTSHLMTFRNIISHECSGLVLQHYSYNESSCPQRDASIYRNIENMELFNYNPACFCCDGCQQLWCGTIATSFHTTGILQLLEVGWCWTKRFNKKPKSITCNSLW